MYKQTLLAKHQSFLDGGYATVLYCRSLQLICMHDGISSSVRRDNSRYTRASATYMQSCRSLDVYTLTLAMIRIIF